MKIVCSRQAFTEQTSNERRFAFLELLSEPKMKLLLLADKQSDSTYLAFARLLSSSKITSSHFRPHFMYPHLYIFLILWTSGISWSLNYIDHLDITCSHRPPASLSLVTVRTSPGKHLSTQVEQ